ncbi:MAG: hypothetical protein N2Z74_05900, partial [Syntrophales bacterium]|nr:hypothetical protein [Syntrophales bacterium]
DRSSPIGNRDSAGGIMDLRNDTHISKVRFDHQERFRVEVLLDSVATFACYNVPPEDDKAYNYT